MALVYLSSALQFEFSAVPFRSADEAEAYAQRLREVENVLLCQAFGGQVPLPSCREQLQRYLSGEISRAEAFHPLYRPSRQWNN